MKYALRTLALPTALAATLVLTGCGTADTSSHNDTKASGSAASGTTASKASTAKNDADFVFATMMIPHHAQAIVMADMALKQTTNPKVLALATKITAAQSPEIQRMSSWLKGWGKPVPGTTAGSGMAGMSGMGGQAGGMMSEQEIANLGRATGSGFDRMWLQMMVKHHQGALDMAKTALAQAANPDTKKLATSIIAGQSAEIAEMNTILAQIPA